MDKGDFFVTKHANLASYHVVFHLITDNAQYKGSTNSINAISSGT